MSKIYNKVTYNADQTPCCNGINYILFDIVNLYKIIGNCPKNNRNNNVPKVKSSVGYI